MGVSKADKFLVYADIHGKIMSISADFPPKNADKSSQCSTSPENRCSVKPYIIAVCD